MMQGELLVDLSRPPLVVGFGRATHGRSTLTDVFQLPELWSLHLYDYVAQLEVDGTSYPVTPGCVTLVPPASSIRYRYRGPSTHLYAHLAMGPDGGQYNRDLPPAPSRLAVLVSPGTDLPAVTDLMESAVATAAVHPERARADVWMVLLRLADRYRQQVGEDPATEYVRAAMAYLESRLGEHVTVPQVAEAVGISPHHLTRVFGMQTGRTVVGYLRHRRVERAHHLLTSSTMSVAAIAAAVGIPDLQAFNKTCRAVTGRSPRALRAQESPHRPSEAPRAQSL
jgi:AraC-like DNA-binding protein